jgi:hypothetical protein
MSLISAFRLFLHLSCETPVYDRSGARSATIGRSFLKYIPPCPMSYAPCPMSHAQCTMHHEPCTMHRVLFMTRFSLCHSFLRSVLSSVLHTVHRPLVDPEREARLYTYPFEIRFSHVENVMFWSGYLVWVSGLGIWSGHIVWVSGLGIWSGYLVWAYSLGIWSGYLVWVSGLGI